MRQAATATLLIVGEDPLGDEIARTDEHAERQGRTLGMLLAINERVPALEVNASLEVRPSST